MIKKILLISSNFEELTLATSSDHQPEGVSTDETSHYPLGLAYLHSYLEQKSYQVKVLFLNNIEFRKSLVLIDDMIKDFAPQVVGLQVFTSNRVSSFQIIERIHKNHPDIKIITGGIHATIMYPHLLKKFPFLTTVLGEGEITLAELLKELDKPVPELNKVKGLAYISNNKIVTTPPRELIADLDTLPFPRHDIYFKNKKRTSACLLTSRGCAFACSFCCLESISRRRVRLRTPKNVVDEIEYLIKNIPQLKKIWIHDDNFFINNNRVIKICDEIMKRGIKMNFICSARIKPINLEMVKKLEQAGFTRVLLGLESGDAEILKRCHKGITPKDAINAFKIFAQVNISAKVFLIVGLPGETRQTILNTAKLIKKLQKIKYFSASDSGILAVYPGTEVYQMAKQEGVLDDEYWLTDKPVPLYTVEHDLKELRRYKRILLSHISMLNFFTPRGFVSQLLMLPYILKYIKNNKGLIVSMISRTIKLYLPDSFHKFLKSAYKNVGK